MHLRVDAACLPTSAIDDLKQAIEDFPGSAEVLLDIDTSAGTRRLRLGEAYRVQHTPTLRAELEHALAPTPASAKQRRPPNDCAATPRSRSATANATSSRLGPLRFSPGVSSTHGSSANAGAERKAAQPPSPSSPWPTLA